MPVSRDLYRAISASFPTGVLIVATLDENKAPRGLLTQAYIGLSTDPPLMLISIDKTSRTLSALVKRRAFVINFLRAGAEDLATLFASKSDEKFREVGWEPSPEAEGSPILREARSPTPLAASPSRARRETTGSSSGAWRPVRSSVERRSCT